MFSVETAGVPSFTEEMANQRMVDALYRMCPVFLPENEYPAPPEHPVSLLNYLSAWAQSQPKPIVLLVDEADSLWDDVLVSFLRQLRDGFQSRPKGFPQSVALVGLRDIREYKMKVRGDNPSLGSGSPFNVKAKSFFLSTFSEDEVCGLLQQHTDDTGQVFTPEVLDKIYEYFQYKEAGHQLLLMAFLQRIVNGGGRIEQEMAVGNGRTDLAVFWKNQVIALELKINHNARSLEEGLRQIARYLDKLGQKMGYLILFEKKSFAEIPWEQRLGWEVREYDGKAIVLVQI